MQVPDAAIERLFPCELAALDAIFEFVSQWCQDAGFPDGAELDVQLVLEELATNMMKYEPGGRHEIGVQLRTRDNGIAVAVWHDDVERFDPTRVPEADRTPGLPLRPGGIGIQLVRKLVEDFAYDYSNRRSTVRATVRVRSE